MLNKTSIITGMEKLVDMEIENEYLRNLIQSARKRFSTAYTIFQTEWWIPGTQFEGNVNFPDDDKDLNEVPALKARKETKTWLTYTLEILLIKGKRCYWDWKESLKTKKKWSYGK